MRRKNNHFIQQLEAKREATKTPEPLPEPDPNAMSDEDLDAELARAREDLRRLKMQELASTREAASAAKPKSNTERTRPLFPSKRRKQWK